MLIVQTKRQQRYLRKLKHGPPMKGWSLVFYSYEIKTINQSHTLIYVLDRMCV